MHKNADMIKLNRKKSKKHRKSAFYSLTDRKKKLHYVNVND